MGVFWGSRRSEECPRHMARLRWSDWVQQTDAPPRDERWTQPVYPCPVADADERASWTVTTTTRSSGSMKT
jgi:hypothetical protein